MPRILLSVPHMGGAEQAYVAEAFASNWHSTVGPNITAFEEEFAQHIGMPSVAVSSGAAAMHSGRRLPGVGPGDEVFCPGLTFVAPVNPIVYLEAKQVFLDSDRETWNPDPEVLRTALAERAGRNRLPQAVIVVHLYGQPADVDAVLEACVPVKCLPSKAPPSDSDGPTRGNRSAPTAGLPHIPSSMVIRSLRPLEEHALRSESRWAQTARSWATQARDNALWYEHSQMGYNYRMGNVLAGVGCGQLEVLDVHVRQRREIAFRYRDAFADLPGMTFMPQSPHGIHTNWLSCFLIDETAFGRSRDSLIAALDADAIESRPVWKPMHQQPLYGQAERFGGEMAEDLFHRGICLPSSSSLSQEDQLRVIASVRSAAGAPVQ